MRRRGRRRSVLEARSRKPAAELLFGFVVGRVVTGLGVGLVVLVEGCRIDVFGNGVAGKFAEPAVFGGDGRNVDPGRREFVVARGVYRPQSEFDACVEIEIRLVLLFQERLEVRPVGADRDRLPLVGRPGGVGLVEPRLAVLDATDQKRDPERPGTADLGVLLDVVRDGLGERLDPDRLAVAQPVDLGLPAREVDELAGVGNVRTTPSGVRTPTLAVPRLTASRAYSTW